MNSFFYSSLANGSFANGELFSLYSYLKFLKNHNLKLLDTIDSIEKQYSISVKTIQMINRKTKKEEKDNIIKKALGHEKLCKYSHSKNPNMDLFYLSHYKKLFRSGYVSKKTIRDEKRRNKQYSNKYRLNKRYYQDYGLLGLNYLFCNKANICNNVERIADEMSKIRAYMRNNQLIFTPQRVYTHNENIIIKNGVILK